MRPRGQGGLPVPEYKAARSPSGRSGTPRRPAGRSVPLPEGPSPSGRRFGLIVAAISTLRNLGPASEAAFRRAGIVTAEQIVEMGADAAYAKLLEAGERPHFIGYYVLHMAIQGRPWTSCQGEEKAALRRSFDAIKARHLDSGLSRLEAELDALGVGRRR